MQQRRWSSQVRLLAAAIAVAVAAAGSKFAAAAEATAEAAAEAAASKPQRVVSLNLCTDQLLLMLAERERIAAVSFLANEKETSAMAPAAAGLRVTHASAEDVFLLKPDLVLAGVFTPRATVAILRRLGVRVEEFAPAYSFADIRANLRRMGDLLGKRNEAESLIAEFDRRLARLKRNATGIRPLAAFYYSNAYTSGDKSLADEILKAAGLRNLGAELGLTRLTRLPLELLVIADPDLVIKGRTYDAPALAQEVLRHPALRYLEARADESLVEDKHTICGTPLTLHAVERLVEARKRLQRRQAAKLDIGRTAHTADALE